MGSFKPRLPRKIPVIRKRAAPGTAPGTLTADVASVPSRLAVIAYDADDLVEKEIASVSDAVALRAPGKVVWLNVDGLGDMEVLQEIGDAFGLHRLALEDVVNVHQRPKAEGYEDGLFLVGHMVHLGARLETEQLGMFVGSGFVVTFQERQGDCFDQVRDRIRGGRRVIRGSGADYLAYALLDALVDAYFPVLEAYGDRIEAMEHELLGAHDPSIADRIHAVKRELLVLRRAAVPHRDVLNGLLRGDHDQISPETAVYLRDVYDHVLQITDLVETYRELTSSLRDLYLTSVSNRMNEVMKVLTIFAAIFIPLSFIAGLYGMNFSQDSPWNMPELRWPYGYPVLLLVMALVVVGLLLFFRRRGWIGHPRGSRRSSDP